MDHFLQFYGIFCTFRSLTDSSPLSLSLYGKQYELSLNHLLLCSMEERNHTGMRKAWDIMTVLLNFVEPSL